MKIEIEITDTENPKAKTVAGKLRVGKAEVKAALKSLAAESIDAAMAVLFPAKPQQ